MERVNVWALRSPRIFAFVRGVFDIAAWYQARQAGGGRGLYEMGRRLDYLDYEVAAAFRDIFRALDAGMRGLRVWLTGAGAHPSDKAS